MEWYLKVLKQHYADFDERTENAQNYAIEQYANAEEVSLSDQPGN